MEKRPPRAFRAVRVETMAGQRLLRLTRPWCGLPVGTEVTPRWSDRPRAGFRTVQVVGGRFSGQIVSGPE